MSEPSSDPRDEPSNLAARGPLPYFTDHDGPSIGHALAAQAARTGLATELQQTMADVTEAFDAIDAYAAKDLDHELHSLVEHYRHALGLS